MAVVPQRDLPLPSTTTTTEIATFAFFLEWSDSDASADYWVCGFRNACRSAKMTRLRGASVSSYDASHSGGMDRSPSHRSKLPPNAPGVIVENTVDVSDPAQVLLWCRDERRRQFNLLVRRLVFIETSATWQIGTKLSGLQVQEPASSRMSRPRMPNTDMC